MNHPNALVLLKSKDLIFLFSHLVLASEARAYQVTQHVLIVLA